MLSIIILVTIDDAIFKTGDDFDFTAMYFSTKQLHMIKLSREKHVVSRRTCSAYRRKSIVALIILRSFLKYFSDIGIEKMNTIHDNYYISFYRAQNPYAVFCRYPSLKQYHSPSQMLPLIFRWGLVSMGDRCQKAWSEIWILTQRF